MLDPGFQESGSMKECSPTFLVDLGCDVIGGSRDNATLGGVPDLMDPGL